MASSGPGDRGEGLACMTSHHPGFVQWALAGWQVSKESGVQNGAAEHPQNHCHTCAPITDFQFARELPSHHRFPSRSMRPHSLSHCFRVRLLSLANGPWGVRKQVHVGMGAYDSPNSVPRVHARKHTLLAVTYAL